MAFSCWLVLQATGCPIVYLWVPAEYGACTLWFSAVAAPRYLAGHYPLTICKCMEACSFDRDQLTPRVGWIEPDQSHHHQS